MGPTITIAVETPLQDEIRGLVAELNAYLHTLSPPEVCFQLTVEQMAETSTTLFVARDGMGRAVGMGALRRHGGGIGEVKRMYTLPSVRGRRIGRALMERIEALARDEGFSRLVLETGHQHPDSWRLYERCGFSRCGPVLDYPDQKWSVFYEKHLTSA